MKIMKFRSLIFAGFLALPLTSSYAQVDISVGFAPPPLPVYEQPPCPVEGHLWTPGYWGYGYDVGDYYWVPGAWVPPPTVGLLWTPSWWGWNNGAYVFNRGYWGGRWSGNTFQYNTAVTRVNTNVVHNTYVNKSVTNNMTANRASFNGPNGVNAQPTAEQKAAAQNAKKMPPTSQQLARQQAAAKDRNLQASVNKGKPNPDAIKSFNKNAGEGAGQGKGGAQEVGAAGGAGAGKKPGNLSERQGTGAGKGGNQPSNVTERNLKGKGKGKGKGEGARAGNAGGDGN